MTDIFSLKSKHILITGASSGIGRQCAIECSKSGAIVTLFGRDLNRLSETMGKMEGSNHLSFAQDLTESEKLEGLVTEAVNINGPISGFIHSAGIETVLPLKLIKRLHYENIFSINVIAGFELTKLITKKKNINQDAASLLFVASVAGIKGEPAKLAYSSSKAAIIAGVQSLAIELASRKIRVNAVSPAVTQTEMSHSFLSRLSSESKDAIVKKHPLGLGTPQDVAYACVYLLSDAARWITGINLIVDGGFCAK